MQISDVAPRGLRFSVTIHDQEIAHADLYLLANDLHREPFGLLEDVQVDPSHQHAGIGRELLTAIIAYARAEGCYKLIATSRNDGTRERVHAWYARLGFSTYGTEFRMDF